MPDLKHDIEKYLRGELSPSEMQALEKKALNDPFLTEALEGAEQLSAENFSTDIKNLQEQLHKRIQEKKSKIVPMWVWPSRIAAGLILVALSTYIIFTLTKDNTTSKNLALIEKVETPMADLKDSTVTNPESPADQDMVKPMEAHEPTPAEIPNKTTSTENGQHIVRQEVFPDEETEDRDAVVQENPELSEVSTENKVALAEAQPSEELAEQKVVGMEGAKKEAVRRAAEAPPSEMGKKDLAKISSTLVRGRVTSAEDGSGLPGVNVVIKDSNTGTITDAEGYYKISIDDEQSSLVYSFIGLQSKEVSVNHQPQIDVTLEQDVSQLSEVVVVGYGTEEAEDERTFSTFEMASPVGGRKAFNQYLEKSLLYPQQAIENKIEGKVTIQFTVETTGELTNFNVIKGIGYGCDEEVIRLINNGPKWTPSLRNDEPVKGRVRVRMRFTLPKK